MQVNQLSDGFELVFLPERNIITIFIMGFLSFWLMGWLGGEITVLNLIFSGKAKGDSLPFLLFWITGWTVGGFFAINFLLALAFGKRIVTVKADSMQISDRYGFWHKNSYYPMSRVKNLRRDSEYIKYSKSGPYTLYAVSADCDGKRTIISSTTVEEDLIPVYELLANSGYFRPGMMTGYMSAPQTPQMAGGSSIPVIQSSEGDAKPITMSSQEKTSGDEMYYPDIPEDLK
jgi:hypothetical protein